MTIRCRCHLSHPRDEETAVQRSLIVSSKWRFNPKSASRGYSHFTLFQKRFILTRFPLPSYTCLCYSKFFPSTYSWYKFWLQDVQMNAWGWIFYSFIDTIYCLRAEERALQGIIHVTIFSYIYLERTPEKKKYWSCITFSLTACSPLCSKGQFASRRDFSEQKIGLKRVMGLINGTVDDWNWFWCGELRFIQPHSLTQFWVCFTEGDG